MIVGVRVVAGLVAAVPAGWLAHRSVSAAVRGLRQPSSVQIIALMMLVFSSAGAIVPMGGILALSLALGWALVCLGVIDLISMRLPDLLTLPLLGGGLAATFTLPGAPIADHLAGAAAGYGALAALAWAFHHWRGVEGIGLGDAKLLAAAGAWLGWRPLPSVLLVACAAAFAWIAIKLAFGERRIVQTRLAFGAPLCLAIWIVWLFGPLEV
jgi:leader peptidase (prepilin peptidase)/N-methyltransferase